MRLTPRRRTRMATRTPKSERVCAGSARGEMTGSAAGECRRIVGIPPGLCCPLSRRERSRVGVPGWGHTCGGRHPRRRHGAGREKSPPRTRRLAVCTHITCQWNRLEWRRGVRGLDSPSCLEACAPNAGPACHDLVRKVSTQVLPDVGHRQPAADVHSSLCPAAVCSGAFSTGASVGRS